MMQPAQEEEDKFRTLWMGELQNWMDKVEGKENRTLCIGGLQHWMDEDYIDSCFAHTGEVYTSKVIRNAGKSSSDEYCYAGFIEFKSHAIAERILLKFNGKPMPRVVVGTTNFSLKWASSSSSSFGSGGEQQQQQRQEEEDDSAAAAADDDDKLQKKITMPPQGQPTDLSVNSGWEDMMKWWSIAKETRTPDVVYATHRVYMIGAILNKSYYVTTDEIIEGYLDELQRHGASIDVAKVLHSIDALYPLLGMLYRQHAGIRGKVTKVIITMVQKNPTSQQLVMEARGREILLDAFLADIDLTLETNILDAISLLLLNGEPGLSAFGSYLIPVLKHGSVNCRRRKTLNLIVRLVEEHNSDDTIVTELEYLKTMIWLVSSVDAEVRKAALRGLIVLAKVRKVVNSDLSFIIDGMLKEFLQGEMGRVIAIAPENLAPLIDEIHLVEKLWKACCNEPSPLREKEGLSVIETLLVKRNHQFV